MHQNIWIASLFAGLPCLINAIGAYWTQGRVDVFWLNSIGAFTFLFASGVVYFLARKEAGVCEKVYQEILSQKRSQI